MSDGAGVETMSSVSDDEWAVIKGLFDKASSSEASLDQVVLEALPTLNPNLIMKLRGAAQDSREEFQAVSTSLSSVLDARLQQEVAMNVS